MRINVFRISSARTTSTPVTPAAPAVNLARVEAQIFLAELIEALPEWEVATPIDYGRNFAVRGPGAVLLSA